MQLPVKLGVSTWLWTSPFRTEDAAGLFEKIASLGYGVVEIAVEDPLLVDTQKIAKELERNGLQALVCGAFGPTRDLTSDDESLQKTGLQYIEDCLNISNELGASFFAGPMYSAVGKARMVPDAQRQIEWNRAVDNLGKVCEMAAISLGGVDKRDSQGGLIVIQAGTCNGDQLGTRPDVGRGMGVS